MRKLVFAISTIALLASCNGTIPTSPEEVAHETARAVIKPIVASRLPGVATDIAVDCVIDNASLSEIFQIAGSTATGSAAEGSSVVIDIMTRPATLVCIGKGTTNNLLNISGILGG